MGYSFSAPCKSVKAQNEMMAFLEEHYRPWDQVIAPFQDELEDEKKLRIRPFVTFETRGRGPVTDLVSDHSKAKIGFDYGAGFSDAERFWMYNFCYWVALRVGRRRTFSKKAPDCGTVPYVLYDGYEAWPVLEKSEYGDKVGENSEWFSIQSTPHSMRLTMPQNPACIVDKAIKTELERLGELWENR